MILKPKQTTNILKIYRWTNKGDNEEHGMIYIGQSWQSSPTKRMENDGRGYKSCKRFHPAIIKYGVQSFEYDILAEVKEEDYENEKAAQAYGDALEDYYIKLFRSQEKEVGYNIKDGGRGGKHSDKSREQISTTMKNKIWSPEAIERRKDGGRSGKGKKKAPATKERKEKVSESMKDWHATHQHPMLGKRHTEESKAKTREKNKDNGREIVYTHEINKISVIMEEYLVVSNEPITIKLKHEFIDYGSFQAYLNGYSTNHVEGIDHINGTITLTKPNFKVPYNNPINNAYYLICSYVYLEKGKEIKKKKYPK